MIKDFSRAIAVMLIFVFAIFPALEPMFTLAAPGDWTVGVSNSVERGRSYHTSVIYNGKIYSFGGQDYPDYNSTSTLDIFDIETSTWTEGADGLSPRDNHTAVVYNNKMYVWGGVNNLGETLNSIDIYDIATDSWSSGLAGGTARNQHESVLYNGKIYSWGGYGGDYPGEYLNTVDIYDIASNTWSTGTAGGTARNLHSSIIYNGKIYSWGGHDGVEYINSLDIYDIATGNWTTGLSGGTARGFHSSVVYNGKIYSWGGDQYQDTMDIYDIDTNTWTTGTPNTGYGRAGHSSVVYENKIYSYGGDDNIYSLSDLFIYEMTPASSPSTNTQIVVKQQVTAEMSLTVGDGTITMLPSIPGLTGGVGTGTTTITAITNNAAGYTVALSSLNSGKMMGDTAGDEIPAYTPASASTPEAWSIAANTAEFGYTIQADAGDVVSGSIFENLANGTNYTDAATSKNILKSATSTLSSGAVSTIAFRAEIKANPNPSIASDWYVATTTLTMTMN